MYSEAPVRFDSAVLTAFALLLQQRLSDVCAHGDISYVLYRRQYLNIPPPEYRMLIRTALETAVASQQEQDLAASDAGSADSSSCMSEPAENWEHLFSQYTTFSELDFREPFQPSQAAAEKHIGKNCATCGRYFKRVYDCKRHELIHTDKKPYKCFGCGEAFKRSDRLNKHWRVHPLCKEKLALELKPKMRYKHKIFYQT